MAWLTTTGWSVGTARLVSAGGVNETSGKREVKDVYGIILEDGSRPAAGSGGIPAYGAAHPSLDGFTVSSVDFDTPDPGSHVWRSTVTYSAGGANSGDSSDTSKYTRLHIGTVTESRELLTDADDDTIPVVNSAGDPFESVPQVERHLTEIQLTRNQSASPASDIESLNGTVNDSAITVCGITIPERCGRISIEADRLFGGSARWSVSFRIVVKPDTWDLTVLENGYRYKDASGNLVKFTDTTEDGRVVECSSPQLLGPPGDGGDGRGRGPYYATFHTYPKASWTGLKLPSSL